jgi:hypothetical protein
MHLTKPRVPPLPESEWDDETRELLGSLRRDGHLYNIFATLARHRQLLKRWLVFGGRVVSRAYASRANERLRVVTNL